MPESHWPQIRWAGPVAFLNGNGPRDLDNPDGAFPESVEAQTQTILANLDKVLERANLNRHHLISVRVHLTQFARFEKRAAGAFEHAFASSSWASVGWIGVDALPREALIEMDFVISREPQDP